MTRRNAVDARHQVGVQAHVALALAGEALRVGVGCPRRWCVNRPLPATTKLPESSFVADFLDAWAPIRR